MANEVVCKLLREMAFFSELAGDNPFKARAWLGAAEKLEESDDLALLIESGAIAAIPGVGKGTQALVKEFHSSGKISELEEMRSKFPPTLTELLEVRGLGPKKVKVLYEELQIGSLSELEYACQENRLLDLKGFGEKTQQNILQAIEKIKSQMGMAILPVALYQVDDTKAELRALRGVERIEQTGELRRYMPVVPSLDFVLGGDSDLIRKSLKNLGFVQAPDTSWKKMAPDHLTVRVWVTEEETFGTKLFETTGPASYVEGFGSLPQVRQEIEIFEKKNSPLLPPELRDLGKNPQGLVEEKDIKGIFHLHTTWSDGKNTLEEMVGEAHAMGFEYIGVSEHSESAFYAHGMDKKRILEQRKEIDRLQMKFPEIRIFQGIESDILADGSLDYPQETLKLFDFVIASVHSQMRMPQADMTIRLCKALENPFTTWLGHWTGRLLLGREAYQFDQEAVLLTAAKHGKGIELNSNPYRLDMDWSVLPEATRLGVPIGIFPDAHSVRAFQDVKFGVWMARKGGITKNQVVNTKSRKEMEKWLQEKKSR